MNSWKCSAAALTAITLAGCSSRMPVTAKAPSGAAGALDRQIRNAVSLGEGNPETRALRAKLDADPSSVAARIELARHFQKLGFPDVALEHLRIAVERAPESADAALALAKTLRDAGRAREGAATLTMFAEKQSAGVEVWAWLGLLRDEADDWAGGEAAHRKAVSLEPARDDLHNNLGYALLRQGKKTEAIAEFEVALRINSRSVVARNNLGTALADTPAEAIGHLQSVADPASAHNNVAVALMEAGKYAEARKEIETALSYNRQNTAALNNLRMLSELDGKPAEVRVVVRPAGSRWARLQAVWRRVTGGMRGFGAREEKNSGSQVASR